MGMLGAWCRSIRLRMDTWVFFHFHPCETKGKPLSFFVLLFPCLPKEGSSLFHLTASDLKVFIQLRTFGLISVVLVTQFCLCWSHGLYPARLISPVLNTEVGCHSRLQGIFLTTDRTQVFCIADRFIAIWATGTHSWIQILDLPRISCVSLRKLPNFSESYLPHL